MCRGIIIFMINKILAILIIVSGVAGVAFMFIPISESVRYIDAGIFILSSCAFGLIETIKIKKYLFTALIGLVAVIFIFGLVASF